MSTAMAKRVNHSANPNRACEVSMTEIWLISAAGQAKQQKNPGAVVACIKQLDWMTGLGINSTTGSRGRRGHR